jgi:hypothetical protein
MRRILAGISFIAGALLSSSTVRGAPIPNGPEFQANTATLFNQKFPSMASNDTGAFVVVWQSFQEDGAGYGVFGQRFDASGALSGSQFQVNTYTTNDQRYPSVAVDGSSGFVVVWQSYGQDGSGYGVFGRLYDDLGAPAGPEFQLNVYTTGNQRYPTLAIDAAGNFVVAWQSVGQDGSVNGIFARRFDNAGSPLGNEFQVNTYTTGQQLYAAVAANAGGDFVVVWHSYGQDGDERGIFGQRFDNTGAAAGPEFQVNSYTTGDQFYPRVAMDGAGEFAVVWESQAPTGSYYTVFDRHFDASGAPRGNDFRVSGATLLDQSYPAVAADDSGRFMVVWTSFGQDGDAYGIFGRRFDNAGAAAGPEFQVNATTTGYQKFGAVTMHGDGDFVASWADDSQDGDGYGIFGRRFQRGLSVVDPVAGGSVDCSDPRNLRPTISWDPDGYDRFRVFISPDPAFGKGQRVSSGDTLLKTTSYTPPVKKWRSACSKALAANPGSPTLYIEVFGLDRDLAKRDPARMRTSPAIQVDVTP